MINQFDDAEKNLEKKESSDGTEMDVFKSKGLLDFLAKINALSEERIDDETEDDCDDTNYDYDDDDDEYNDERLMDPDDFHNRAVQFSRRGMLRNAIKTCEQGLKRYPDNVDLIADIIKYSSYSGDMVKAQKFFEILNNSIPYRKWNWRAYTFALDYLIQDPIKNESLCRELISNFKNVLPHEERASLAESELEQALGNIAGSMEVLVKAIETLPNACQCAIKLADLKLEQGGVRGCNQNRELWDNSRCRCSTIHKDSISFAASYFG